MTNQSASKIESVKFIRDGSWIDFDFLSRLSHGLVEFFMGRPTSLKALLITESTRRYADLDASGAGQGRWLPAIWSRTEKLSHSILYLHRFTR
jgi:hypothetical protein